MKFRPQVYNDTINSLRHEPLQDEPSGRGGSLEMEPPAGSL